MTQSNKDDQFLCLVMVALHPWCCITSVEYYVWVQDRGQKIDIDEWGVEKMAYGVSSHIYTRIDVGRL